ncbi:hypothetical protein TSAR_007566 [Trichomalopsis sarcophagae]|uniref:Uncharacterized protein n=1 Tax=Trichomalopsis sarcophagae TaxID=543379 RepID=A0A232EDP1_9HYME|nr:hypothetical protein TSAR_007566 [Trichomalopsis sarcophagae]
MSKRTGDPLNDREFTLLCRKDSLVMSWLIVPMLNPELALKLQSHAKTRDSIMQSRQNISEAALNALGAVLTAFIEEKSDVDRKDC